MKSTATASAHAGMQIEESFRDMKSARFGRTLEFHRSRDPQRLAILLLILAPALLVLWLIGRIAEERGLMRHYQANTVRHRKVLSVIFLGIRIIERAQDHFIYRRRIMHRLAKHPTP
ncbi:MAG: hypothetical protein ACHBNF_11415 [Chromatiales bacterium]